MRDVRSLLNVKGVQADAVLSWIDTRRSTRNERDALVIRRRDEGATLKDVAAEVGLSISGVHDLERRLRVGAETVEDLSAQDEDEEDILADPPVI